MTTKLTLNKELISGLRDSSAGLIATQPRRPAREAPQHGSSDAIRLGTPTCETRSAKWFQPSPTVHLSTVCLRLLAHPNYRPNAPSDRNAFSRVRSTASAPHFSRLRVQPTHLLPAGMEITSYNHHCKGSFLPSVFVLTKDYRVNRAFALIQSAQARTVVKLDPYEQAYASTCVLATAVRWQKIYASSVAAGAQSPHTGRFPQPFALDTGGEDWGI